MTHPTEVTAVATVPTVSALLPSNDAAMIETPAGSPAIRRLTQALSSSGTLAILDQATISFANFATSVLIARSCSRSELGIYVMATSLLYFVRGFQEQLIAAPYTIYRYRKQGRALKFYTGNTLVHQLVLAFITQILIGALAVAMSLWLTPQHGLIHSLVVLLMAAPCFLLREHLRKLNFAHFEFRAALLSDSFTVVLQSIMLLGLYFSNELNVVSAFVVLAIATGIGSAVSLWAKRDEIRFLRRRLRPDWTENWVFGKWALFTHLVGCSTPYIMPWLVASLRGEAVTGTLGACQSIVGMANMFVTGVSNFLSPRTAEAYARGGTSALLRTMLRTALLFTVTLGGFSVLMWACGEALGPLVMGKDYHGLGSVMVVLSLALLVNSLGMTAGNGIWAMDRPSLNLTADVTSLVATIAFALLLVPDQGAMGAAIATLLGHLLSATQRWWIVLRLLARMSQHSEASQ